MEFIQDLLARGEEPEVESVKRTNLAAIPESTLDEFFALNASRAQVKATFQQFWLDHQLDALLCPAAPTTATPLDEWSCVTYTMLWNLLDYPALVMPAGRVSDADVVDDIKTAAFGPDDEKNYKLCEYSRSIIYVGFYTDLISQTLASKISRMHHWLCNLWA